MQHVAESGNRKRSFGQIANASYVARQEVTITDSTPAPPILPRLAAGESRAMNVCIDRFGGLIWSIVRRAIRNESEAEDLVQQIFTEIWKKADSYNAATASETTFVALIARRRTIDHLRKTTRQPEFEPLEAAATLPAHDGEIAADCDAEAVRASLATLPDDTRDLFRMFFEEGFTHPEIAGKTGLPLGTIKTRLRRGLLTLRDHLRRAESSHPQPAS
jgi:RNA polymerase sigma-70 factor (ECF subfamily)